MLNELVCAIPFINAYCGINFNLVFLWTIPFICILIFNEVLDRNTNLSREVHRKIAHSLTGVLIIISSFYLLQIELLVFSMGMLIGAYLSKIIHFKTIYSVERYTHGTIYYVLVVAITTYLWIPDNVDLFRYGVLILTIPDALAAVVGSKWGKQIPVFNKSILGSVVFFVTTVFVTLLFTQVWWIVLLIAALLTVIEFFSQWGIDNLLLPIAGGYLLLFLV